MRVDIHRLRAKSLQNFVKKGLKYKKKIVVVQSWPTFASKKPKIWKINFAWSYYEQGVTLKKPYNVSMQLLLLKLIKKFKLLKHYFRGNSGGKKNIYSFCQSNNFFLPNIFIFGQKWSILVYKNTFWVLFFALFGKNPALDLRLHI